ncbi:hypothetical protein PRK78_005731 [Emydomyces testavorans]|uniref:Uncharacterized protein n=1 Tax=Emydomyces testavorans TaxID=2070801 RepID=A0AAF0DMQ8_9EURO|nr:hypothetical protein PRK78_005731 [Emydomyces testavorans]
MASPDVYPPLLAVDATHHGAWVVIVAAIGLTMTFACLLIRVYVRVSISPAFGVDDIVLLAAMACALAQNGVTFGAISNGFGNSIELIEPGDLRNIQKVGSDQQEKSFTS